MPRLAEREAVRHGGDEQDRHHVGHARLRAGGGEPTVDCDAVRPARDGPLRREARKADAHGQDAVQAQGVQHQELRVQPREAGEAGGGDD